MKKTANRRELAKVFCRYIRLGLDRDGADVFDIHKRIEGVSRSREEAYRLLAMYDTCRVLRLLGKGEVINTLRDVYLPRGSRVSSPRFLSSEINMRVIAYAVAHHWDERTVWRRLAYAAELYSKILSSYKSNK